MPPFSATFQSGSSFMSFSRSAASTFGAPSRQGTHFSWANAMGPPSSKGRDGERRPAGQKQDAAERRDGAPGAHAGQSQDVKAAGEDHGAGGEARRRRPERARAEIGRSRGRGEQRE